MDSCKAPDQLAQGLFNCQTLLTKCQTGDPKTSHLYARLFAAKLNSFVRCDLISTFWSTFSAQTNKHDPNLHKPLLQAIKFLSNACKTIEDGTMTDNLKQEFFAVLRFQILALRPYFISDYLHATYLKAFKAFLSIEKLDSLDASRPSGSEEDIDDEEDDIDDENDFDSHCNTRNTCSGCSSLKGSCDCRSLYKQFCEMNTFLQKYDLSQGLIGDTVMNVARIFIERKVSAKGKSNYSCSYLSELAIWVQRVVKKWIVAIYGLFEAGDIEIVTQKLDGYLKDAYADVRVSHMFEIIIEYPNSEAAIQDLKICLEQSTSSNFRLNLIDSVKQSLIESLLHPGVNTYDILTAYISAIKALRALDPTGLILQLVTEPVRRYLKSRDDTVRCIVTALTDEDHNSELNREMIKSSSQTNENGIDGKSGAIELSIPSEGERTTQSNFELWKPDPIKLSLTDDLMKSSRFSDIVSILVNIYETKDLFVEEYQKLLSQRLLNKYDECNLDTELRNLELLTLRFSDCELHRCEVMLKDVQTSKRINKRILSGDIREHKLENFKNLDVLIVSSPFWPEKFGPIASLSDEAPEINFPADIESAIDTYTKAFEAIQASRTLHWRHHLGSVNLDLSINGKTQNYTVSPLHAAILYLFKEKKSWRLSELMHKTSLPAANLRSKLALWCRNGVIRDSGEDIYDLIIDQ